MSISKLYRNRVVPGMRELNAETIILNTIADLEVLPSPVATNATYKVMGYHLKGDCNIPIFSWNPTSVDNNAPSIRPPNIISTAAGRWELPSGIPLNVRWFGAKGDGTTDDSAAMQNAVNASVGKTLIVPRGTFLVYQLTALSGTKIEGENGSAIKFVGPNCFVCSSIDGFSLYGLEFQGDNTQIAVFAGRSKNITIERCKASCRLFAGSLAIAYSAVVEADLNQNIRVINNICIGTNKTVGEAAIYFIYCDDVLAEHNTVKTYLHGIAWWGGSADADGAETNPRKCRNIRIANNFVSNIGDITNGGGGIWGSMGQKVIISNNNVSECSDVGIDFEGTWDGIAISNVVKNCSKGCLTTFFLNRKIIFANNIVEVENPAHPLWRNYNSTQEGSKDKDILIEGNHFTCTGATVGFFDCLSGPCSDLVVKNNTFKNVYIDININNQGATTIEGNEIITTIQEDNRAAIRVAFLVGAREILKIESNKVLSHVAQPIGSTAILVDHKSPNEAQTSIIKDNYCHGFLSDIVCLLTTPNTSVSGTFIVQNNIGTAGVITIGRDASPGLAPTALKFNNMKTDGTAS